MPWGGTMLYRKYEGAVETVMNPTISKFLVGDEAAIKKELKGRSLHQPHLHRPCIAVVEMPQPPTVAIRKKRDSPFA